jgi:hypothetical protein
MKRKVLKRFAELASFTPPDSHHLNACGKGKAFTKINTLLFLPRFDPLKQFEFSGMAPAFCRGSSMS